MRKWESPAIVELEIAKTESVSESTAELDHKE